MIVEKLLMDAVKDGHLSALVVLLIVLLYQMRQNTKSIQGVQETVSEIATGTRKALDDNISQQGAIEDNKKDIDDIKDGVVWDDTFQVYKEGTDKRISLIENKAV